MHKYFLSRLAVVYTQSIETRREVENEQRRQEMLQLHLSDQHVSPTEVRSILDV